MEQQPLVSVIINCYNGEKYLREAIDSVIAQTYTNWEIIFWDNQSTDSTAEIVKSYKDERIKYFYAPEHTPLGEARNLAMAKINGDFFCFLDTDDVWLTVFIEMLLKPFDAPQIGVSYCRYINFENDTEWLSKGFSKNGELSVKKLVENYNIGMSAALVRSSIPKKYEIRFSGMFSLIEDFDFFVRIASYSKCFYSQTPLMRYRIHPGSLSKNDNWANEYARLLDLIDTNVDYGCLKPYYEGIKALWCRYEMAHLINSDKKRNAFSFFLVHTFKQPTLSRYFVAMIMGKERYLKIQNIARKIFRR